VRDIVFLLLIILYPKVVADVFTVLLRNERIGFVDKKIRVNINVKTLGETGNGKVHKQQKNQLDYIPIHCFELNIRAINIT
jgi:hypothetical protein